MTRSQIIILLYNIQFYYFLTVLQLYDHVIQIFNYIIVHCSITYVIRCCSHANTELFRDSQYDSLGISINQSYNICDSYLSSCGNHNILSLTHTGVQMFNYL